LPTITPTFESTFWTAVVKTDFKSLRTTNWTTLRSSYKEAVFPAVYTADISAYTAAVCETIFATIFSAKWTTN
jgi:hypothetical protein